MGCLLVICYWGVLYCKKIRRQKYDGYAHINIAHLQPRNNKYRTVTMTGMKRIFILTLLTLLSGCDGNRQEYHISTPAKPETIILKKVSSQGNIHSIEIVGSGYLDGTAEIVLILNEKPYITEKLSGKIDFNWNSDWYSDSATIEYKPSSVKNGKLQLQYKFKDI
jgi:hypothetical protein